MIAATILLRDCARNSEPPGQAVHSRSGACIWPDDDGGWISNPVARKAAAMASMADRLSASMAGNIAEAAGAMKVNVDRNETTKAPAKGRPTTF